MDISPKDQGFKKPDDLDQWEKVYWYLRIFVDTNRFGKLSGKPRKLIQLYENLIAGYGKISQLDESEESKIGMLDSILLQSLLSGVKKGSNTVGTMKVAFGRLKEFLIDTKDYFVLGLTIRELLLPTNEAVGNVPTTEVTDFARTYARAILDTKKEKGLPTLIREWDTFTEDLALNRERDIIIDLFKKIREGFHKKLESLAEKFSQEDMDKILSAVSQEYERRVGQKRKQRAGVDLESATEFLLNYFGFKTHGGPEHFTASLEVDNWLKDKNGWYVGISLKRTLRERWKQTYTSDIGYYNQYKVKNVIHILNNDFDLSDAKITELARYRHLFCLADGSPVLKKLMEHGMMNDYVFPMSNLITKLKELTE